jgi:hypothetical protein
VLGPLSTSGGGVDGSGRATVGAAGARLAESPAVATALFARLTGFVGSAAEAGVTRVASVVGVAGSIAVLAARAARVIGLVSSAAEAGVERFA